MSPLDPTDAPIPPEPVRVVLVNEERYGDAPFNVRLRRALKCLLRGFGLRCTSIQPDRPEPAVESEVQMNIIQPATDATDAPAGFTLWHRTSRRARWQIVVHASTVKEADDQIGSGGRRHGQWLTLPVGQDANASPAR